MKKKIILAAIIKFTVFISAAAILVLASLYTFLTFFSDGEVLIQSLESRTRDDKAVFNKITHTHNGEKDIWMMNQSHFGLEAFSAKWERLAIVIENKKVSFFQLEPGELKWDDSLPTKQVGYRATCFICHNNGPRAVRPDGAFPISWANRVKILFWNLRIKSYRRLQESSSMVEADLHRDIPFRHREELENQELKVRTCIKCHSDGGFFARNFLKRQQAGTIDFMVKNKIMPPSGFFLSAQEEKEIKDFVAGF